MSMSADDSIDDSIGVEIDLIPDNDRFLPRYLTIQLLSILSQTIAPPKVPNAGEYSAAGKKFIESCRSPDLFTPLTYSVFWREQQDEVLAKNLPIINDIDKYNRSALSQALANEDFVFAQKLLDNGANVYLEDKLILEISLTCMLQRDTSTIQKILSGTADHDVQWVKEYLEYLHSYSIGKPNKNPKKYHDVLNPPVRHFGQVLDTLVYFNGVPSHYGFVSPSLKILTAHLQSYAKEVIDNNTKALFDAIATAYRFSQNTCKFHGNLPQNADAGRAVAAQIVSNFNSNSKDPIVIFGGWAGNSIALAFINKTVVLSNLGVAGNPQQGTKIYSITDAKAITPTVIENFLNGLGTAADPNDILAMLGNFIDAKPLFTINQPLNPIDNCILVNPRAIIQGLLLVLAVYSKSPTVSAENLPQSAVLVADMYKSYLNSLYKHSAQDLANFMRNHELLQNKRIECCSLALEYINQHYKEPEAIQRCIELKNALEFVGLKDFYQKNILPEAKTAIQKQMIRDQELTAVKVIEQEYAILANQK